VGRYKRLGQRLGHSRGFASFAKRVAPPIDKFLHKVTGGRLTFAGTVLPTLVLVHTGRRSGKRVRTPLSYVDTGDAFVLAATNFGQAHHPAWSYNLMANPEATIEVRGRKIPVRARRVDDSEKAQLWPHFVDIWPAYDTYVERSRRDIRVFVLERRIA
jgi:deazaflavin-dependent oxidoreductase (nitroreductase family)